MVPRVQCGHRAELEKLERIICDFLISQENGLQLKQLEDLVNNLNLLPSFEPKREEPQIRIFSSLIGYVGLGVRKYSNLVIKVSFSIFMGILVYYIGITYFGLTVSQAYLVMIPTIVAAGAALVSHSK
jgi:hypothetical protein